MTVYVAGVVRLAHLSGWGEFPGIIWDDLFKEGEKATRDVGEIASSAIGLKFS